MSGFKNVDFYGKKSPLIPRMVYRRLAQNLRNAGADRRRAIDSAVQELCSSSHPDMRKMKFVLPEFLRAVMSQEEQDELSSKVAAKRRLATRLLQVFPHCSDEFALNLEFLHSVLGASSVPDISEKTNFFTIGSCFARNIAVFLSHNGMSAATFPLAEDLNSPISNAFILNLLTLSKMEREHTLLYWVEKILAGKGQDQIQLAFRERLSELEALQTALKSSGCIVLTLGNLVDFFHSEVFSQSNLLEKVYPKFIALPASEDIEQRSSAAHLLRSMGAVLRLATHDEAFRAIELCVASIRKITEAPIILTLSPVPIDSAIGIHGAVAKSAIEIDCVSKSRLRSALHEFLSNTSLPNLHYFPSFEIVRWIAPMLSIPNFGMEDAASRHVSSPILDAVCALFMSYLPLKGIE